MTQHNPQAEQMGDESMLRTLAAQAEAIWPQEQALFGRYALPSAPRILDLGCGSGEIAQRLAARYPAAEIVGIDILAHVVELAADRHRGLAPRVGFETGDAFQLRFPDGHFDLVVCRHMIQAIPRVGDALREMLRVLKPGGWLHLLAEDYGMLRFPGSDPDPDRFWRDVVIEFGINSGVDARIGRHVYPLLKHAPLADLRIDYVTVDTERVPREVFARILEAWRDGYVDTLSEHTGRDPIEVESNFAMIVRLIRDPDAYSVWQIPVWSARRI